MVGKEEDLTIRRSSCSASEWAYFCQRMNLQSSSDDALAPFTLRENAYIKVCHSILRVNQRKLSISCGSQPDECDMTISKVIGIDSDFALPVHYISNPQEQTPIALCKTDTLSHSTLEKMSLVDTLRSFVRAA